MKNSYVDCRDIDGFPRLPLLWVLQILQIKNSYKIKIKQNQKSYKSSKTEFAISMI